VITNDTPDTLYFASRGFTFLDIVILKDASGKIVNIINPTEYSENIIEPGASIISKFDDADTSIRTLIDDGHSPVSIEAKAWAYFE
jgi:hypothetical protein